MNLFKRMFGNSRKETVPDSNSGDETPSLNVGPDGKPVSGETLAFFQSILNWTFPGAAMYYRDAELAEDVIAQYEVGQIIRSQIFVDVSSFAGKPVKSCRYIIATNKAAAIYKIPPVDENMARWTLHTINANSYFKVLDIYRRHGKTQIFLLHIPAKGIELFQKSVIRIADADLEKQFVERARASFDKKLEMPPAPELEEEKWTARTCDPVGMDMENRFFPLVPQVDIFDNPKAASLYKGIFEMTGDNELNSMPPDGTVDEKKNAKDALYCKALNAMALMAIDANPPKYEQAFSYYQMGAEKGSAESQYNLAALYYNGQGTDKDLLLAAYWFHKAGDFQDAQDTKMQATLWYFAENIDKWSGEELFKATVDYCKMLYNEENPVESANSLLYTVATSYYKKRQQDFPHALKCYRAIAEFGNDGAVMCLLSTMYASGEGVEKDLLLAAHWAKKAHEQRHEDGKSLLLKATIKYFDENSDRWSPAELYEQTTEFYRRYYHQGDIFTDADHLLRNMGEQSKSGIVKVNIAGDCIETKIKKGSIFSIGGEKYVIKWIKYKYRSGYSKLIGKEELDEGHGKLLWPYDSEEDFIQEEIRMITKRDIDSMYQYRLKTGVYVIYYDHLYPCFDWCDHECENRYYRSYHICLSFEEAQTKLGYLTALDYSDFHNNVNPKEKHRVHLTPYVYFDDGAYDDTFTVYEKK
jgi:TPR repeat protein